ARTRRAGIGSYGFRVILKLRHAPAVHPAALQAVTCQKYFRPRGRSEMLNCVFGQIPPKLWTIRPVFEPRRMTMSKPLAQSGPDQSKTTSDSVRTSLSSGVRSVGAGGAPAHATNSTAPTSHECR